MKQYHLQFVIKDIKFGCINKIIVFRSEVLTFNYKNRPVPWEWKARLDANTNQNWITLLKNILTILPYNLTFDDCVIFTKVH